MPPVHDRVAALEGRPQIAPVRAVEDFETEQRALDDSREIFTRSAREVVDADDLDPFRHKTVAEV